MELAAALEHPNIARVYDSGLHQGIYYYAMELIHGVHLDAYVREKQLSQDEILELMRTVGRAVRHAHLRGVIHRDLKPSNILVSEDGQPHVLDFGLAKALIAEGQDPTVSLEGEVSGTPAYMSPEQASGHIDRIDTRSDVYSLGVILFRLLTRRSPHNLTGARYEIIRRIAEDEVPRPRSVNKHIDHDLEALLLKALAYDPEKRYPSAGEFARDIGSYLSGEPLEARLPTTMYFLLKWTKRHIVPVSLSALILTALLGMAVFSYVRVDRARLDAIAARNEEKTQRIRAESEKGRADAALIQSEEARDLAKKEADRADSEAAIARDSRAEAEKQRDLAKSAAEKSTTTIAFLKEVFSTVTPERAQGRTPGVREMLDSAAKDVGQRFAKQPEVEAELRNIIGIIYSSLGRYDDAQTQLEKSLALYEKVLGPEHPETLTTMSDLAATLVQTAHGKEAVELYRKVLALKRDILGHEHPETLATMHSMAGAVMAIGKYGETEKIWREVQVLSTRALGEEHPITLAAMHSLARLSRWAKNYERAERIGRDTLRIKELVYGENHPSTLWTMTELAYTLSCAGKREEGEKLFRKTLTIQERVLGPAHRNTMITRGWLTITLLRCGRRAEAEKLLRQEVQIQTITRGKEHRETLVAMTSLASFLSQRTATHDEARELYDRTLATQKQVLGKAHVHTLQTMHSLATRLLLPQHKYVEAEKLLRDAFTLRKKVLGINNSRTLATEHALAVSLEEQDKLTEAEKLYRETFEATKRTQGWNSEVVETKFRLAHVLKKQNKLAEASKEACGAMNAGRNVWGIAHQKTLAAALLYLTILDAQKDYGSLHWEINESFKKTEGSLAKDHQFNLQLLGMQADAFEKQGKRVEAKEVRKKLKAISKRAGD